MRNCAAFFAIVLTAMFSSFIHAEPTRTLEKFTSGGQEIRVETFSDAAGPEVPSVIVLHGSTGVEFANRFIANLAQSIAAQGFVVHLVHYFDRTGSKYADDATIKSSSADWLQTVHDSVAFVRKQRPHAAIGLFGYSLGGYLAAAEAVSNEEIGAAVILAGGLDPGTARSARHALPVLILHGAADNRVPVSEARKLEAALTRMGQKPEVHLYPGEGHIMSMPTYADVVLRSVTFLRANLQTPAR